MPQHAPALQPGQNAPHAMISWTDLHLKRSSMESFELVLVLLACVIIAAVAGRVIRRV